jgi:hypothetical protein
MRQEAFTIVFTARTSNEAESLVNRLRDAGLHPAELGLTVPLPLAHKTSQFPVEVPSEEADRARKVLA